MSKYLAGVLREAAPYKHGIVGIDPGADGAAVGLTVLCLPANICIISDAFAIQAKRLLVPGEWTATEAGVVARAARVSKLHYSAVHPDSTSSDVYELSRHCNQRVEAYGNNLRGETSIAVERVGGMPHDGRASLWKFGVNTGRVLGSFNVFSSDIHPASCRPSPKAWQKLARRLGGMDGRKWSKGDASACLAQWNQALHSRLVEWCLGRRRMPSGVADAFWIALYHATTVRPKGEWMLAADCFDHMDGNMARGGWGDVYIAIAQCDYDPSDANLAILQAALARVGKAACYEDVVAHCSANFVSLKHSGNNNLGPFSEAERLVYMKSIGYVSIVHGGTP